MKICVLGIGAAGNKCVANAVSNGTLKLEDTILINSTSRDFPEDYNGKKIILSERNAGAGKERSIAKSYIKNAINQGAFNLDLSAYDVVYLVASVEGGTGSGSTPLLAQFFTQVCVKHVHVFALTGFLDDIRGISNTLEFFKELDDNIIIHTISNAAFLQQAHENKMKAEELANREFCNRYNVLSGQLLLPSMQNIDETDIVKLANTFGYTIAEYKALDKSIGNSEDYDTIVKRMVYESKSLKSNNPCATKLGVILNLKDESKEAMGDIFKVLKASFGMPFECFQHIQYDGKKEYIAFIASGLKLPIDELENVYNTYNEQIEKVNKDADSFFDTMKTFNTREDDNMFNMLKPRREGVTVQDFLKKF